MFFLLRLTFWLGLVCVLLPSSGNKPITEQVDTLQAVSAAGAAYSDMRGFCERQPGACVVGGQVASALGQRAQEGAKTIVEFISQQMSDTTASTPRKTGSVAQPAASHGTLTPVDMAQPWRAAGEASVPLPPVSPRREAQNRRPSA